MSVDEVEEVTVETIGQYTDEEDRYIKMKDAYKEGKLDCEACLGSPVTAAEMAEELYGDDEDRINKYLMGWNYQLTLMTED